MEDSTLDALLTPTTAPAASVALLDAILTQAADRAAHEHRSAQTRAIRTAKRRLRLVLATSFIGIAGAATAAAMHAAPTFTPDTVIPISYVTSSGYAVECTYSLAVRSWDGTDVSAAKEWVATHDWSGIGQRGYDSAVAAPMSVGDDGLDPGLTQESLDRMSVSRGIATVIIDEIPGDFLDQPGVGTAGNSTCNWEFR